MPPFPLAARRSLEAKAFESTRWRQRQLPRARLSVADSPEGEQQRAPGSLPPGAQVCKQKRIMELLNRNIA